MSSSRRLNPYEFIQGGCSSESPRPRFTLPRHPSEVTMGCHAQPLTRCSRADLGAAGEPSTRCMRGTSAESNVVDDARELVRSAGQYLGLRRCCPEEASSYMWARLTCGPLEGRLHAFNLCRELSMKLARYRSMLYRRARKP